MTATPSLTSAPTLAATSPATPSPSEFQSKFKATSLDVSAVNSARAFVVKAVMPAAALQFQQQLNC
ncbi:MAG: hypothetical protein FRX49_13276 [Trebouxia sp. A1-2]|nr:MAG: hypothetical protein FRX49_13276 [Trebouxia sp. A1-2]